MHGPAKAGHYDDQTITVRQAGTTNTHGNLRKYGTVSCSVSASVQKLAAMSA